MTNTPKAVATVPTAWSDRLTCGGHLSVPQSVCSSVLEVLLDSIDCGVLLFSADGTFWGANAAFSELLQIEPGSERRLSQFEEAVAWLSHRCVNPAIMSERWRERFHCGDPAWDEIELLQPRKAFMRFARPIRDANGRRMAWMEIYHDVTHQRLVESRLFHSQRIASLGQLLSGIAHELNNPLTSIVGYAQLLLRPARRAERETDARHILEEAERASRIAKNLLAFARENKPERTLVNLNEIAHRTVALRSYEHRLDDIRLELDLDAALPPLYGDALQLQQMLLNLVLNAEQAVSGINGQGRIRVSTRTVGERVILDVADNGPGVDPSIASRIFDPFFTTKPPGQGTGLGLSIVYGIVQKQGGRVSLEDRPEGGAFFRVELPLTSESQNALSPVPAKLPSAFEARKRTDNRTRRVLVIEDEPTVARLIAEVLREEGHQVDLVLDSRDGLELARRNAYDLAVCDLRMPYLDGRAFYRELALVGSPLEHRLLFVTGDTLGSRTVDFLKESGLPYLAKPFLVDELKEAVRNALAGRPGVPSAQRIDGAHVRRAARTNGIANSRK